MGYLVKEKDRAPAVTDAGPRRRVAAERVRHRRRLIGHRRRQAPLPRRHPVRLLRAGPRRRRQLGLRQLQRHVGLLREPRDQHLVPADGVLRLPDARRLPALRAPRPGRRLLRAVRRPLRLPRHDHLRHDRRAGLALRRRPVAGADHRAGRHRDADVRRRAGRQRPPLGRPVARAGLPRHLRRRADPRARLPLPRPARRARRRRRRRRQLRDGHLGRGVLRRADDDLVRAPHRVGAAQVLPRQALATRASLPPGWVPWWVTAAAPADRRADVRAA